jgi:phage gp36-like protein
VAYITQQDLLDELGLAKLVQLTDSTSSNMVDAARVAKAISSAEGTFESYARTRYELPVPATEKVKSICVDLAVFNLKRSRTTTEEGIKNLRVALYDPAIRFLEALSSGKAALDIPAASETATSPASPDKVKRGSNKRKAVFSDEKLGSY